jgi:hypothetical protein
MSDHLVLALAGGGIAIHVILTSLAAGSAEIALGV